MLKKKLQANSNCPQLAQVYLTISKQDLNPNVPGEVVLNPNDSGKASLLGLAQILKFCTSMFA
jgi:hypothetical protein